MRRRISILTVAWSFVASLAMAQGTPTGTISGRASSNDGLALPGVTVTAVSPVLQGERGAVTTANGDFLLAFLPPGEYVVTFTLNGFKTLQQRTRVAAAEVAMVNPVLEPAAIAETVEVVGMMTETLKRTAPAATTYSQNVVNDLPLNRGIDATVALTPGAVRSGPSGATGVQPISISGASSFENLVLVNGVVIQDNIRRTTDATLFIEDALQETTVTTSSVSAEFGRFNGGVVNAITKSGGNRFDGTFRVSFENDGWRALTPFAGDSTSSTNIPIYEYTAGGPVLRDRLWFFAAGRTVERTEARTTAAPARIPYDRIRDEKRFEGKLTVTPVTGHTVKGAYLWSKIDTINDNFTDELDLQSLTNRVDPGDLRSVNYTGVVGSRLFVEAQYASRNTAIEGAGAQSQDLIDGTLIVDGVTAARFHSATFCGVCRPEERDNESVIVKASSFLSTAGWGSHQILAGYDGFNDKRAADAHQSGSGYRVIATSSIWREGQTYPVFDNVGSSTIIRWNPIFNPTQGTNFRTHAVFLNDVWQVTNRLTVNAGVRYDWNDGVDSSGSKVVDDSRWSPRLAATWDPTGTGTWTVNGSYATYVAGIANPVANLGSSAGSNARFDYQYLGPQVNMNPGGPLLSSAESLRVLFDWFNANGGTARPTVVAAVPGVNTRIATGLRSPAVNEFAAGVTRRLGARGLVRVDGVYRDFSDFYATRADTTTGQVSNDLGQVFDVRIIENTNIQERRYAGLNMAASWRAGTSLFIGAGYTLSRAWGNVDGENVNSGPTTVGPLFYPEYVDLAWNDPEGNLATDQRHKARIYATYTKTFDRWGAVTVGGIHAMNSGLPYAAIGLINSGRHVTNPGYRQAPASVNYYFSERDAFHTDAWYSTDLAVTYAYKLPVGGGRQAELFVKGDVLNVFNQDGLVVPRFINTGVVTNLNRPATLQPFNPFTERPVEGTHWALAPEFGTATSRFGYQTPRTFRMSVGVRF
jgi:outer membrane receptor for ferrienterochelin and colicin